MKITVAICTWNRSELLDRTLAEMRHLRIPQGIEWELLVVNNNCTDDTDAVLERHSSALPLRRLLETRQGHSHARNCAVAAATGELIIWTDDDVLVDPEWMAEYARAATRWTEASFFGGTVDPWYAVSPPTWMTRHADRIPVFVITQHGSAVRPMEPTDSIAGASMAFRTETLRRWPFNSSLGRVKDGLHGADDTELLSRLTAAG